MLSTSVSLNFVYTAVSGMTRIMGPSVVKPINGLLITSILSDSFLSFTALTSALYTGFSFCVSGSQTKKYCLFIFGLLYAEYIPAGVAGRHEYNVVIQDVFLYH